MRAYILLQAPPAATGTAQSADDRGQAFRAVEGGGEVQSGDRLLVIAYMAIWLCVVVFVIMSSRKQSRIDARIGLSGPRDHAFTLSLQGELLAPLALIAMVGG